MLLNLMLKMSANVSHPKMMIHGQWLSHTVYGKCHRTFLLNFKNLINTPGTAVMLFDAICSGGPKGTFCIATFMDPYSGKKRGGAY